MNKPMGGHERPNRGETDEWLTPPEIIKELGPFDLDPCSPIVRPWDTASLHYTIEDHGLMLEWKGFVWLNPPYGPEAEGWLNRMAMHNNGIALIFARTETRYFHRCVWEVASSVLFLKGRLYFYKVDGSRASGNAGAPSVFIGYGEEADKRLSKCDIDGHFISLLNNSL